MKMNNLSVCKLLPSSSNSLGEEVKSLLVTYPRKILNNMNRFLDDRTQKRIIFSTAWNDISDCFRQEDIISNR